MKTAQQIVVGDYVIISNIPCVVVQARHSKPGKHVMKALIQGRNIFTQRKMDNVYKFTEPIEVFNPIFQELQIVDINDDWFATILGRDLALREIKIVDLDLEREDILKAFHKCQIQQKKIFAKIVKVKNRQEVTGFKIQ